MRVVYTPTAVRQLESPIAYLISQDALRAAERVRVRIISFVSDFVVRFPKAGRYIPEKDIFEIWIPRTKYVLLYRVEPGDVPRILALFHASQDRTNFESDET